MNEAALWPELPWPAWQDIATTLHMWTQMVGKTRLALTPMQNHWWNIPLYVSAHGLTTSAMPWRDRLLEIEFNFQRHILDLRLSSGASTHIPLEPQTVASFFERYKAALTSLGVSVPIWPMPVEVADPIPFDRDHIHAAYDPQAVERFHTVLMHVEPILKRFSTGFLGKISPVHFFWGSFDLCVTRFSGRRAEGPPRPDRIQQEAYSHEVSSAGFWPGNGGFGQPAFYSYAAPVPPGLAAHPISPGAWDPNLAEFVLLYDTARRSPSPAQAVLDFLQTTYAAAADTASWNRTELERPIASPPSA